MVSIDRRRLTCFASPTSQIIVLNATSPSACFCCIKAILSANLRGLLMINQCKDYKNIQWHGLINEDEIDGREMQIETRHRNDESDNQRVEG